MLAESDASILEHDVARAVQVWVFVIALDCVLAGTVVARALRTAKPILAIPLVMIVSGVGVVWYIVGVQFQFGVVNSAFAIAVLLAAWVAYMAAERSPLASLGSLFVIATGTLAVWSPLVICVAGLGATAFVRSFRQIRTSPPGRLALASVGLLAFLAYGDLVTLPGFLAESAYLGADGGFPAIGPASVIVIASVTTVLACIVASGRNASHAGIGALAFIGSFVLGLAYLLLQRKGEVPWDYYPAKFAWTASIVLIMITISLAAVLLARHAPRTRWETAITGACLLLLGSLF